MASSVENIKDDYRSELLKAIQFANSPGTLDVLLLNEHRKAVKKGKKVFKTSELTHIPRLDGRVDNTERFRLRSSDERQTYDLYVSNLIEALKNLYCYYTASRMKMHFFDELFFSQKATIDEDLSYFPSVGHMIGIYYLVVDSIVREINDGTFMFNPSGAMGNRISTQILVSEYFYGCCESLPEEFIVEFKNSKEHFLKFIKNNEKLNLGVLGFGIAKLRRSEDEEPESEFLVHGVRDSESDIDYLANDSNKFYFSYPLKPDVSKSIKEPKVFRGIDFKSRLAENGSELTGYRFKNYHDVLRKLG